MLWMLRRTRLDGNRRTDACRRLRLQQKQSILLLQKPWRIDYRINRLLYGKGWRWLYGISTHRPGGCYALYKRNPILDSRKTQQKIPKTKQTKTRYRQVQKKPMQIQTITKNLRLRATHQYLHQSSVQAQDWLSLPQWKKKRTIIAIAIAAIMFFVFNRTIYRTHRIVKGTADSMFAVPFIFMLFKI